MNTKTKARFTEIMSRHQAGCTVDEFHHAVNVTFHRYESAVYDEIHQDMWQSLPPVFERLVSEVPPAAGPLRMLDIGCGTGLASECMLNTKLGQRITSVNLLDTAPEMLERARQRISARVPVQTHLGMLESLQGAGAFDVIVTCSVLHHVIEIPSFLAAVRALQAPGGVFVHLQDPNNDASNDPVLKQRMEDAEKRPLPDLFYRVSSKLTRLVNGDKEAEFLQQVNQDLTQSGIVKTPLTIHEIYEITDVHVQDGEGISVSRLGQSLTDYKLLTQCSYGFFGRLSSTLPEALQAIEKQEFQRGAMNGFHVGAAWCLR